MIFKAIVATILTLYVILLVSFPRFGIVDDHQVATNIRLGNSPRFSLNVSAGNGHFEPLDSQEYTALGRLFEFTPGMCYSFNAAQLALLAVICVVLLKDLVPTPWACITIAMMLVSPGFVAAWFRLNAGERGALFWTLVGLWGVHLMGRSGRWRWLVVATIASNIALYYKEPVFAGFVVFSGLELFASITRRHWCRKNLAHAMLLVSAAVFLATYFFLIARYQTGNYADQRRFLSTAQTQIFNFRTYLLVSHPLLFLILVPDAIAAGARATRTRGGQTSTLDSLSIAGLSYIMVITYLNISTTDYYLAPAYAFGLSPVARRLSSIAWGAISFRTWACVILAAIALCALPLTWIAPPFERFPKESVVAVLCIATGIAAIGISRQHGSRMMWSISAALALVCVVGNQIPVTVNQLAGAKYGPWSFQHFLVELRTAIRTSDPRPVPIFIVDSPRAFYVEGFQSIGEYLRLDFAVGRDFDMFSEVPAESRFVPDPESPYSVLRDTSTSQIKPGALLVGQNVSPSNLRKWSGRGRLLYLSSRPYWRDVISLDSAIQNIKSHIKAELGYSDSLESGTSDFCLLVAK